MEIHQSDFFAIMIGAFGVGFVIWAYLEISDFRAAMNLSRAKADRNRRMDELVHRIMKEIGSQK